MKKKSLLFLLLCFTLLLTACGESDKEKKNEGSSEEVQPGKNKVVCTFKTTDLTVGDSNIIVALQYNSDKTLITKITKEQNNIFTEDFADFVNVTKDSFEASCAENKDLYDSCEVSVDGRKVSMVTSIEVKADSTDILDEGITAKTSVEDAIKAYNNAGYVCE